MNVDGSDDDEFGDDDMMFELEQEEDSSAFQPLRPPNPVAALLRASDNTSGDDDDEVSARRSSGADVVARLRPDADTSGLFEDFNGRRKRKMDDSFPSARITKRAKSFSSLSDVLPPLATFSSVARPFRFPPTNTPSITVSISSRPQTSVSSRTHDRTAVFLALPQSASIRIPQTTHGSPMLAPRSITQNQLVGRRCKSAEPRISSSWHTHTPSPLDMNCRRSLDVSSPLRQRFQNLNLVVGSVGQHTGSLSSS